MIRTEIPAALAVLIVLAAAPARGEQPNTRVSSWSTTTHIFVAPLKPADLPVATAALPRERPAKLPRSPLQGSHRLDGVASYYWQAQGTASGERFDRKALTAAHPTLPFGTRVRVTNLSNGRTVVVRINDRGPFKKGRVIDLSDAAAEIIDMRGKGLAPVRLAVVD